MAALVFNAIWRDSAFAMILLMAGLKSVPLELFAAARVDWASAFYQFRRITLPLAAPALLPITQGQPRSRRSAIRRISAPISSRSSASARVASTNPVLLPQS